MKRALLIGMGSAGDVFPFISLGRALKQRGWGVDLMANPAYLAGGIAHSARPGPPCGFFAA